MRFMMIVKASKDSEAGVMPPLELVEAMGKFIEEMVRAGVMLAGEGLQASSKGCRVHFAEDGKRTVIDGPFTETKELIAGFWLMDVKSKEEAVAWAMRCPCPAGLGKETALEIRKVFEASDFGPDVAKHEQALREEIDRRTLRA